MFDNGVVTLLLLFLIIFAGIIFFAIVKLFLKIYMRMCGSHLPGRYKCHYYNERQIKNDEKANRLAQIAYRAYTDVAFDDYQERLDEKRFPLNLLVNWTRTIAEDIVERPSPILRVKNWSDFFDSEKYQWLSMFLPYCLDFYTHELAYLWGAVYYWLKTEISNFTGNEVLVYIEEVACKRKFARFYFEYFKKMAGGDIEDHIETSPLSQTKGALTAEQTALLWLAIAKQSEGDVKNKKDLAPVIHQLTGFGKSSVEIKICGIFKDADKEKVANMIECQMPKLAKRVRNIEK